MERHPRVSFTSRLRTHPLGVLFLHPTGGARGQTLVEVAAALGVAVIIIAALVGLGIASMRSANFSKNRSMSVQLANEALEAMRVWRDSGNPFPATTACYSLTMGGRIGSSAVCGSFQPYGSGLGYEIRAVPGDFVSGSATKLTVTATVRFTDSAGVHETAASTVLTNWR